MSWRGPETFRIDRGTFRGERETFPSRCGTFRGRCGTFRGSIAEASAVTAEPSAAAPEPSGSSAEPSASSAEPSASTQEASASTAEGSGVTPEASESSAEPSGRLAGIIRPSATPCKTSHRAFREVESASRLRRLRLRSVQARFSAPESVLNDPGLPDRDPDPRERNPAVRNHSRRSGSLSAPSGWNPGHPGFHLERRERNSAIRIRSRGAGPALFAPACDSRAPERNSAVREGDWSAGIFPGPVSATWSDSARYRFRRELSNRSPSRAGSTFNVLSCLGQSCGEAPFVPTPS